MKRITSIILALALLVGFTPVSQADPLFNTKVVTLLSSAVRAKTTGAITVGSAVSTGVRSSAPLGSVTGFVRNMQVFVDVTACTTATEDVTIQGRTSSTGTWITLQPLVGSASSAWTQITASTSILVRRFDGPIPGEIRALVTTGAGTGTSTTTLSITALLGG